jgi:antitoxin (DNA-binding transcriptional repressor) of toxin-antitoxin stability system
MVDQLDQVPYPPTVPTTYSIGEAKTNLSKLIHLAEEGEEVVLRRGPTPVARLVAIPPEEGGAKRSPGRMRGRVRVPDDFDVWPEDIARSLGIPE